MAKTFENFLDNASKSELSKVLNSFNELSNIFGYDVLVPVGLKKEELVNYLINNKKTYITCIIKTLNYMEYTELLKGKYSNKLFKYIESLYLVDSDGNVYSDIQLLFKELLKNKKVIMNAKKMSEIETIIDGMIVAYGVISIEYFEEVLSKYCNVDGILEILKIKSHDNYIINNKMLLSTLLTNKNRIVRYYDDENYKEFSIKELKELGNNIYHHSIRYYKSLMKILNNNYVFGKKDIKFIDESIIIPYLYTSLNEESDAKDILVKKLEDFFEFREEKIRTRIYDNIVGIRECFPLWEYRGFSIVEVEENE